MKEESIFLLSMETCLDASKYLMKQACSIKVICPQFWIVATKNIDIVEMTDIFKVWEHYNVTSHISKNSSGVKCWRKRR